MENQAFGWLKLSIKGLGGSSTPPPAAVGNPGNSASIGACAALAGGVSRDLDALLLLHASTTTSTSPAADAPPLPPPGDGRLPTTAAAAAAADDGGGGVAGARTTTSSSSYADSLDDLTARLDRIKYLLYEERSSRASAPSGAYRHGGGWTPPIAGGVLESFTTAAVASSKPKSEPSTTAAAGEGECSGGDGDDDNDDGVPPPPDALLPRLMENLPLLPFEARKSVSAIFNYLLVCGLDGTDAGQFAGISEAFAAYVLRRADGIIGRLVRAHDCGTAAVGGGGGGGVDIALLCGSMLRSSLRHAPIYRWALSDPICERLVYPFLDAHVHNPNFDVSSDALETVRVMLTGNASASAAASSSSLGGIGTMGDAHAEENRQVMEGIASDFLNRKYADVVDDRVNRRCLSPDANYMTRRMTLQLLSSILLNRANYNVMMMYISSSRNLVTILCLLRDPSPHITLDAFQVFKIFVANPNKVSRLLRFIGARADAPFRT